MARKFFYVCAGLLCLAISYHLGAKSAGAQVGGSIVSMASNTSNQWMAVTSAGDTYLSADDGATWQRKTNIFAGGPTPAKTESFGAVKARYR